MTIDNHANENIFLSFAYYWCMHGKLKCRQKRVVIVCWLCLCNSRYNDRDDDDDSGGDDNNGDHYNDDDDTYK